MSFGKHQEPEGGTGGPCEELGSKFGGFSFGFDSPGNPKGGVGFKVAFGVGVAVGNPKGGIKFKVAFGVGVDAGNPKRGVGFKVAFGIGVASVPVMCLVDVSIRSILLAGMAMKVPSLRTAKKYLARPKSMRASFSILESVR